MTKRERFLATTLGVVAAVFGGGLTLHLFVIGPLSEVSAQRMLIEEQLVKKQGELEQEKRVIDQVLKVNPRLVQWQKISLPPRDPNGKKPGVSPEERKKRHVAELQVDYAAYLGELMQQSGFQRNSISVTMRQPDRHSTLKTPKGKEPTYERLAFQATGKAALDAVARMLREFHKTPLLHQVRTISIGHASNALGSARRGQPADGTLDVNMTVEALMVAGAEDRVELQPSPSKLAFEPRVLSEANRDYGKMSLKNMFAGAQSTEPPRREAEAPADVLRFVKLTTIFYNPERRRWEASLYDQAAGPTRVTEQDEEGGETKVKVIWEKQINTRILNELKFSDRYNNTVLEGKVVHIDEGQVVFKAENKFYRLRCGDALYPAIEKPLSAAEVKELGLAAE